MHMADALVSPAVGGAMWAAAGGLASFSAHKLKNEMDERKVPLMGVLGAFIFSAQMINFAIPGTGSSGHLGGGMILAILLGPYAGFITIFSVLAVQALFFADGGLIALGCNAFNLGFFPCFIAYPFIYRKIVGRQPRPRSLLFGTMAASIVALQLGALAVVLETFLSGISEIPFATFTLLMQPIHLAIGMVEGLITFSVVTFVWKARPELLGTDPGALPLKSIPVKALLTSLFITALLIGGVLSWFASSQPDGLEWSLTRASSGEEPVSSGNTAHEVAERIQNASAILPDYDFKAPATEPDAGTADGARVINTGTTVAGLVGALLTLALVAVLGILLRLGALRHKRMVS